MVYTVTPFGKFLFTTIPFGLVCATFTFQRLMDEVLRDMTDRTSSYIDDILIYSKTWEDRMNHIEEVLGRLERRGLTVRRSKCEWGR